ncbi:MAG: endonuclease/exonuclease/phosphatase family metal-dependent hydrolase [Cyclobacteriaceae bacterium]|jgi:endonuclease/exonuclease/phosphatase family metal-dependent hydrolase
MISKFKYFPKKLELLSVAIVIVFFICQKTEQKSGDKAYTSDAVIASLGGVVSLDCGTSTTVDRTFNVLTQNVGFIPGEWLIGIGFLDKRYEMAKYLIGMDADIVVIQEGLSAAALKSFTRRMDDHYPYHTDLKEAYGAKCKVLFEWGFHGKGHGIVIFSKYPILAEQHFNFDNCADGSHDCKVAKGFVKTTLDIGNGGKVYVVGTHLQAGSDADAVVVRNSQVEEISQKISEYHNTNYPMILAGDFNIDYRGQNGERNALIDKLNVTPTFCSVGSNMCNVIPPYTVPDDKSLDYIFLKNNHVQPYSTTFSSNNSPIDISLSDHASVKTTFSFALQGS